MESWVGSLGSAFFHIWRHALSFLQPGAQKKLIPPPTFKKSFDSTESCFHGEEILVRRCDCFHCLGFSSYFLEGRLEKGGVDLMSGKFMFVSPTAKSSLGATRIGKRICSVTPKKHLTKTAKREKGQTGRTFFGEGQGWQKIMMFPYTTVYHKTLPIKFPDFFLKKTWRISPAFPLEAPRFPKILRFLAFEEAFWLRGRKNTPGGVILIWAVGGKGGENGMLASWLFVCAVHLSSSSSSIVWPGALYNPIPSSPHTKTVFTRIFSSKKGSPVKKEGEMTL